MALSQYNKGRPFLIITQHLTPMKGENTSLKGWGKTGKKNLQEIVTISETIKNSHMVQATVIIDIVKRKVVKSRYPDTHEEVISHYLEQYKKHVAEGIQVWMAGRSYDEESAKKFMLDMTEELDIIENSDKQAKDTTNEVIDTNE